MAKRHYTADSVVLLPSSSMLCVRSDVTGRCAIVPGAGPTADGIVPSIISATTG